MCTAETCRDRREPGRDVARPPAPVRTSGLRLAARDYIWLFDFDHGVPARTIAALEALSVGFVRSRIAVARRSVAGVPTAAPADPPPDPVPLFPVGAFTPSSACPHRGLSPGPPFVCMVCHRDGSDAGPVLLLSPG